MTYQLDIGITIFGQSESGLPEWNYDAITTEFKQFVESNSEFSLNLIINKYPPLANNEIGFWEQDQCYFMAWWDLSTTNTERIPKNVQMNIVPYHYNSLLPICWQAGTWGGDSGLYGIPWISQPFGYGGFSSFPPWNYHAAHDMVHEWLHALDDVFLKLGFPEFPASHDIHDCEALGYKIENGWADCYKYFLSTITDQMYQAIQSTPCPQPDCNYELYQT